MDNIDSLISVFKTCFHVCIAVTVLFLIISVVLFFIFDIKTIFSIRTGRAKKKTIKEMQEANSTTGRLRVGGKTLTSQLSKKGKGRPTPAISHTNSHINEEENSSALTDVLPTDAAPTELLANKNLEYDMGAQPTSQLNTANVEERTNSYNEMIANVRNINFKIIKNIMLVHTEEIIN